MPFTRAPAAPLVVFVVTLAFLSAACGGPKGSGSSPAVSGAQAPDLIPHPPDAAATELQPRVSGAAFTLLGSSNRDGIVQTEVAYPSGDLTVRGFLFVPAAPGRRPAVVFNHGGVSGVSDDMKRRARDLARLGYVVLAPAYRGEGGSDGVVEVARGEVDDVLAGADILSRHPRVDSTRMAVAGTSHGALVSVLAAAREPDRFVCLVEACGVMDVAAWYRYLVENDFDVSDSLSVAVYGTGPEDKPEAFAVRSAVAVAGRVTIPVLIQQGMRDRIVPPAQARAFRKALEDAGRVDVTLLEYPLLGHAFWGWTIDYHPEREIEEAEVAWADFTAFLAAHLGPS